VPFDTEKFLADVRRVYLSLKRAVICASEGIRDSSGKLWAKRIAEVAQAWKPEQADAFGHFQLSGTGALADYLAGEIKRGLADLGDLRVRADTFGYLQRSFPGFASKVDAREARAVGRAAVKYACKGQDGSIAIKRAPSRAYKSYLELVALEQVAGKNRAVPQEFICPGGNDICPPFRDYALPLTGGLPETAVLE
jgi:6-phosphofructokinase 1